MAYPACLNCKERVYNPIDPDRCGKCGRPFPFDIGGAPKYPMTQYPVHEYEHREAPVPTLVSQGAHGPVMWDKRFLELAKQVASWSKDPSTQTGAVIVDAERRVVAIGYNGFPRGVADELAQLNNRDLKYKMMVHCERNAVMAARQDLRGCTLYTWPFMSCAPCAAMMIQAGITRCVAPSSDNPRWQEDFEIATSMFKQAGVELFLYGGLV